MPWVLSSCQTLMLAVHTLLHTENMCYVACTPEALSSVFFWHLEVLMSLSLTTNLCIFVHEKRAPYLIWL